MVHHLLDPPLPPRSEGALGSTPPRAREPALDLVADIEAFRSASAGGDGELSVGEFEVR